MYSEQLNHRCKWPLLFNQDVWTKDYVNVLLLTLLISILLSSYYTQNKYKSSVTGDFFWVWNKYHSPILIQKFKINFFNDNAEHHKGKLCYEISPQWNFKNFKSSDVSLGVLYVVVVRKVTSNMDCSITLLLVVWHCMPR